jgi:DNA invertase Pin-like site-specific DNA recombinase
VEVGIYARISDDRAGGGLGVARQEADCRELAQRRGWHVAEVYVDNDISAFRGKRRPAYERLLGDLKAGRIGGVVAWHPDRLHRSPTELETFIDVVEASGAVVATAQGGEYDLSTASGRMTARIVGAVARGESEHRGERMRSKHLQLARAGEVAGGGHRPFGYESDRLSVVRAEAELIRDAARRLLSGDSLRGVAAEWNAAGITTTAGGRWSQHVLRRVLMSGRIAGLRDHRGETVGEATWPAIISRADHERLVRLLGDPARRTNRSPRRYLLTGIACCGLCGVRLVARPRGDKVRTYVCASGPGFEGCGKIRRLAEPVEDLVVAAVWHAVDDEALAEALDRHDDDGENAAVELADVEGRMATLAETFADGSIGWAEWLAARDRLDQRAVDVRRRLAADTRASALAPFTGGRLRAAWAGLSFDRRRAVVAAVVDAVVVHPAVRGRNRFDPTRVDIRWRA